MAQTLRPASTVTLDAGWSVVGPSAHGALNDSSDATYITSGTEGDVCEVALDAGSAPLPTDTHRLWVRTRRFGASPGPVLIDFSLICAAAVVATFGHAQPFGVGFAWYSWDLSAAQVAAITDYADLRIRSVDTQTVGAVAHYVAEQYLELGDPAPSGPPPTVGDRSALQVGKRRPLVQAEGVEP